MKLTDERIDEVISNPADDLLDFIYENGTSSEGVEVYLRRVCRAIEAHCSAANDLRCKAIAKAFSERLDQIRK